LGNEKHLRLESFATSEAVRTLLDKVIKNIPSQVDPVVGQIHQYFPANSPSQRAQMFEQLRVSNH
jgi:hypothetical protein